MKATILCESCGWKEEVAAPARVYLPACCDKCGAPSQDLLLVVEADAACTCPAEDRAAGTFAQGCPRHDPNVYKEA